MAQVKLLAFAGSTRTGSLNQRLLDIAVGLARAEGAQVRAISLREFELPPYDGDMEANAFPPAANELRQLFIDHDGFLIASPEYNGSVSGVLKNAIDWVSRPRDGESLVALRAFRGKVAGIMSASIGPFGGLRGLLALRQILATIQTLVVTEQVLVPNAEKAFVGTDLVEPLPNQLLPVLVKRLVFLTHALNATRALDAANETPA